MSISDFENASEPKETKWEGDGNKEGPFDNAGASQSESPQPQTTETTTTEPSPALVAPSAPSADDILSNVLDKIGDVGEKPHFKLMVIGPPGQGKSSLLLSATHGLGYDFEDGFTRAKASPLPVNAQAIPYTNMDDFRALVGAFMVGDERVGKYEVFGIDTLSDLHKRDLAEITERDWRLQPSRNRYVPETEQYTEVNERIVRIVRALRDLPINIVINSHSKTVEPKNAPSATYADFSESLSNKVMAMMDMVGYLQMKNVDDNMVPVLRFKTDGIIRCKAPSFIPEEIVSPSYDQIRSLWEEGIKNAG
jgi:hypothetical protein